MTGLEHLDGKELLQTGYRMWVEDPTQDPVIVLISLLSVGSGIPPELILAHLEEDNGEPRHIGYDSEGEDIFIEMEPDEFALLLEVMIHGKVGELH